MSRKPTRTYLPALKGRVGKWAFYTTLMKFSELTDRVHLSDEIYKNKKLSKMIQRMITEGRAENIAQYITTEEERFFPAMVVAVFEGSPNWLEFSISTRKAPRRFDEKLLDLSKLDSFGFLELTGKKKLFPLDGQHRLAGIREALSQLQSTDSLVPDDEIAVMLVSHDPSVAGRVRSRRLFTVLNKRAVPVRKHETIALDEDDVMAIATRHLVENFKPLSREKVISYRQNANITYADRSIFTTIVTLYDTMQEVFKPLSGSKIHELKYNRPSDDWLSVYLRISETYFELMFDCFPEVSEALKSRSPSSIIAEHRHDSGGHILFRPVGQKLLSELISSYLEFHWTEVFEDPQDDPEEILSKATSCLSDAFDMFSDIPTDLTQPPYAGLIWIPETRKMSIGRMTIVRDIVLMRYGFLSSRAGRLLSDRLQKSIGTEFSIDEFLW